MEKLDTRFFDALINALITIKTFNYITPSTTTIVNTANIASLEAQILNLQKLRDEYVQQYDSQVSNSSEIIKSITQE